MTEGVRDYAKEQQLRDHELARELREQVFALIGEARVSAATSKSVMEDPEAAETRDFCHGEMLALERFANALVPIAKGLVELVGEDDKV